jgi:hypothetical protein
MSSSEPQQERLSDLKRRALELRHSGDVNGALSLLAQARDLEFENVTADELDDPTALKKLAVVLKNKGDLEGAKAALIKAKQLGRRQLESKQDEEQAPKKEDAFKEEQKALREDNAEELDLLLGDGPISITFTEEEMMDLDMMTEFKLGGMDVPSQEEYAQKIAACKQAALAAKQQGDKESAVAKLRSMKQLQAVKEGLLQMEEGLGLRIHDDDDQWLEELNREDNDLVGQFMNPHDRMLDLDDLDDMDSAMLKDAMDVGMEVPSVEDVLRQANEKKVLALELKRNGDIQGAKAALIEFKKMTQQAEKLEGMLKAIQKKEGGGDIPEEDLDALLLGSEKRIAEPKKVLPPKSAEELKQEALRHRSENNMTEATKVFKLYKETLQKEAQAVEMTRRREIGESMRREIEMAKQQWRLFTFYQRFVDAEMGTKQLACWAEYSNKCANAATLIEEKGSGAVMVSRKASAICILEDDVMGIVGNAMDPSDERLEVSILDVLSLQENSSLSKVIKGKDTIESKTCPILRVSVTIQLPLNEHETDKSIDLTFEPTSSSVEEDAELKYRFETSSQYVNLPRGDTRFAKTVLRRMERKHVQICVYHVVPVEKPKGWFGMPSSSEKIAPVLLGKVVLDLKDLLTTNCIAGDFPLVGRGSKPAGGIVRLCLRTGVPFDPHAKGMVEEVSVSVATNMRIYEAMAFSPLLK